MHFITCKHCQKKFHISQLIKLKNHTCNKNSKKNSNNNQNRKLHNKQQIQEHDIIYPYMQPKVVNIFLTENEETPYSYDINTELKKSILKKCYKTPKLTIFKNRNHQLRFYHTRHNYIKQYNIYLSSNFIIYNKKPNPKPKPNIQLEPEPQFEPQSEPNLQHVKKRVVQPQKATPKPVPRPPSLALTTNSIHKIMTYLYDLNKDTTYYKFLENKRVAIVGPSQSIQGTKQGPTIETYDLIVRLNKSVPTPKRLAPDIGYRTDIIYNSMNRTDYPNENIIDSKLFISNNVKYVCSPYPPIPPFDKDIIYFIKQNRNQLPFHFINYNTYKKTVNNLNQTRPYTGFSAIVDILSSNVKELYVTGQDFYMSKYYSSYRKISNQEQLYNRSNRIHQVLPQINYLRYLALTDLRLKLDKTLDYILFSSYNALITTFQKNSIYYSDSHPVSENIRALPQSQLPLTLTRYNQTKTQIPTYFTLSSSQNNQTQLPLITILTTSDTQKTTSSPTPTPTLDLTKTDSVTQTTSSPTSQYIKKFFQLCHRLNISQPSYEMFAIFYIINNYYPTVTPHTPLNLYNITRTTFRNVNEQYLFLYLLRKQLIKIV